MTVPRVSACRHIAANRRANAVALLCRLRPLTSSASIPARGRVEMHDEKILVIEEKIAYQEHSLQAFHDRLVAQQKQIDLLEAQVASLVRQLGAVADAAGLDVAESEVPPHY